ncbi:MAG: hypothetical protein ABIK68_10695 [bacterium]
MAWFQKRIQKRRMPEEKITGYVRIIEFDKMPDVWLPQFEAVLHKILRYEFYLDKVPDNLALPKYRAILVRVIFRMLNQAFPGRRGGTRNIQQPDPRIMQILEYIKQAELEKKKTLFRMYPVTMENVKAILKRLKKEREI